jgi:deoxyribonuclease V
VARPKPDPRWTKIVASWKATQTRLARKLIVQPLRPLPRFVAGADAAFSADGRRVLAAAVVYDRRRQCILEVATADCPAEFPYIPTFLSFREGPALLQAIGRLRHPWGAICFDGQGYAHPRRCGLALHMSVLLDVPGIGVAKSRLIGDFRMPAPPAGSWSWLTDHGDRIGIALRTGDGLNPLFISVGHRVDLASARRLVMACVDRYRIPEPTRQADIEVTRLKTKG